MSTDVRSQVRAYTRFYVSTVDPIGIDEILAEAAGTQPVHTLSPRPPRRRLPGWVYAAAVTVAVLVVGIGLAWLSGTLGSGTAPIVTQPEPVPEILPESGLMRDPSSWSWVQVEAPDGDILSDGRHLYRIDGQQIWYLPDGAIWREVTEVLPRPDFRIATAAAADGRLLLVSALIDGSVATVVIEAGEAVETSELAVERNQLGDFATTEVVASAVGPRGALIWTAPVLDYDAIARAAFGDEFKEERWIEIRDGIVSLESAEEELEPDNQVPLTDLGIDLETLRGDSLLWLSSEGQTWKRVPASGPFDFTKFLAAFAEVGTVIDAVPLDGPLAVVGVDDGFIAGGAGSGVWSSLDGTAWQQIAPGPSPSGSAQLIPWRGQALFFNEQSVLYVTSGGVESLPIPADAPSHVNGGIIGVGGAGLAYVDTVSHEVVTSVDGRSWSRARAPAQIVDGLPCWCWWLPRVWVGTDTALVQRTSDEDRQIWQATSADS